MEARLPAHVEIAGLLRQVQSAGGFGTVVKKGEREAGTILIILTKNGVNSQAYERMPQPDGTRKWHCSKVQDPENKQEFEDYLSRRVRQDDDLWVVELDIANGERFIGLTAS